jgi:hypothetical protein
LGRACRLVAGAAFPEPEVHVRIRILVIAFTLCTPALARAQVPDTAPTEQRKNVFSIQPWSSPAPGPRLELERSVSDRLSLVLGSRLTLRHGYLGGKPLFSELDLGVRYYADGRAFHGPFVGLYAGYDRVLQGFFSAAPYQAPRAFLGATAGYDFVVFRRLIIGPALGFEYGRPSPAGGTRTWSLHPRLGIGFNFE